MLDAFEIVTTSGVVLWSRSYATIGANIINSLIREVFIEQNGLGAAAAGLDDGHTASKPAFKKDQYTLKWTAVKELGLIFVVKMQNLLLSNFVLSPCAKMFQFFCVENAFFLLVCLFPFCARENFANFFFLVI
jgi:hypothetical protein